MTGTGVFRYVDYDSGTHFPFKLSCPQINRVAAAFFGVYLSVYN